MERTALDRFPPLALLAGAREEGYIGEPVSQLEHALQCAALAQEDGAGPALVAAALLHDIGHLCADWQAPRMGALGVVAHEWVGARYLATHGLPPEVCALVAGHVAAKRYRVATDLTYRGQLSAASLATLELQGGPMGAAELHRFGRDPLRDDKLRLRSYDERAKIPSAQVPGLSSYTALLQTLCSSPPRGTTPSAGA